jgi:D-arabinose 1-dehydrogenase-like Zn-dependent alcohol dehydrogenase
VAKIRRVRLRKTGWDENLGIEELEEATPALEGEQVEIEVEACGVCYRDTIDREGGFPFIRLPITPGHEVVGRIAAVGPDVTDWKVDDRVATLHRDSCGSCDRCLEGEESMCPGTGAMLGLLIDGGYASRVHMKEVFELHARSPFDVQIHSCLDLAEADRAQRTVRAGGLRGRIVLVPTPAVAS